MYSAPYGFPNAAAGPTFNGAPPPQPQNLHLQHQPGGHAPNQPPQQMIYNPQQFAMAAASQGPYPGGPNMMPAAGPGGMMQNAAMPPHMAANGQMAYQTPYTSSPYGAPIPSPAVTQPQMQSNFGAMQGSMPGSLPVSMPGSMPGYAMNAAGMPQPQQQMMQRMHPSQQPNGPMMGASTPQRQYPPAQGNGTQMSPQPQSHPPQFSPHPPQPSAMQTSLPNNTPQPHATVTTPQTPTFPHPSQGAASNDGSGAQTPMSPGTESREKQRFAVLLDINAELMYEALQLQNTLLEHRKDHEKPGDENAVQRELTDEEKIIQADYTRCMRRLQTNLAYLATLVDPKSGSKLPCPAYLMAPTANFSIKLRNPTPKANADPADGGLDAQAEREERSKTLKELYARLQALYPGIDYTKEPIYPIEKKIHGPGQGQNPQAQGNRTQGGSNQASPAPPSNRTPQMATLPAPG